MGGLFLNFRILERAKSGSNRDTHSSSGVRVMVHPAPLRPTWNVSGVTTSQSLDRVSCNELLAREVNVYLVSIINQQ